jgi:hypothetical protein
MGKLKLEVFGQLCTKILFIFDMAYRIDFIWYVLDCRDRSSTATLSGGPPGIAGI